jgi:hypothetical protein
VQELIGFVNDFIETDHQVALAKCTERDNEKYRVIRESLNPFYGSGVDDSHYRHPQTSEEFFQINSKQVEEGKLIPRVLKQLKKIINPEVDPQGERLRILVHGLKPYPVYLQKVVEQLLRLYPQWRERLREVLSLEFKDKTVIEKIMSKIRNGAK